MCEMLDLWSFSLAAGAWEEAQMFNKLSKQRVCSHYCDYFAARHWLHPRAPKDLPRAPSKACMHSAFQTLEPHILGRHAISAILLCNVVLNLWLVFSSSEASA